MVYCYKNLSTHQLHMDDKQGRILNKMLMTRVELYISSPTKFTQPTLFLCLLRLLTVSTIVFSIFINGSKKWHDYISPLNLPPPLPTISTKQYTDQVTLSILNLKMLSRYKNKVKSINLHNYRIDPILVENLVQTDMFISFKTH